MPFKEKMIDHEICIPHGRKKPKTNDDDSHDISTNRYFDKQRCRHSSVDSSAPTILLPRVRVRSTPSTPLSFVLYLSCEKDENGVWPILKKTIEQQKVLTLPLASDSTKFSVTNFGEISPLWRKLKCLWRSQDGLFSIWQKLLPTVVDFVTQMDNFSWL